MERLCFSDLLSWHVDRRLIWGHFLLNGSSAIRFSMAHWEIGRRKSTYNFNYRFLVFILRSCPCFHSWSTLWSTRQFLLWSSPRPRLTQTLRGGEKIEWRGKITGNNNIRILVFSFVMNPWKFLLHCSRSFLRLVPFSSPGSPVPISRKGLGTRKNGSILRLSPCRPSSASPTRSTHLLSTGWYLSKTVQLLHLPRFFLNIRILFGPGWTFLCFCWFKAEIFFLIISLVFFFLSKLRRSGFLEIADRIRRRLSRKQSPCLALMSFPFRETRRVCTGNTV